MKVFKFLFRYLINLSLLFALSLVIKPFGIDLEIDSRMFLKWFFRFSIILVIVYSTYNNKLIARTVKNEKAETLNKIEQTFYKYCTTFFIPLLLLYIGIVLIQGVKWSGFFAKHFGVEPMLILALTLLSGIVSFYGIKRGIVRKPSIFEFVSYVFRKTFLVFFFAGFLINFLYSDFLYNVVLELSKFHLDRAMNALLGVSLILYTYIYAEDRYLNEKESVKNYLLEIFKKMEKKTTSRFEKKVLAFLQKTKSQFFILAPFSIVSILLGMSEHTWYFMLLSIVITFIIVLLTNILFLEE